MTEPMTPGELAHDDQKAAAIDEFADDLISAVRTFHQGRPIRSRTQQIMTTSTAIHLFAQAKEQDPLLLALTLAGVLVHRLADQLDATPGVQ